MRIFVFGVPHTQTRTEFNTCAFTMKAWNLCRMMHDRGHEVIHLGVGGSNPVCSKNVEVVPESLWRELYGHPGKNQYTIDSGGKYAPLHQMFAENSRKAIMELGGDPYSSIVACTWGGAQQIATFNPDVPQLVVESGIGYRYTFAKYRVFESYAWLHMHWGKDNRFHGDGWYDVVIPNAFDPDMFKPVPPSEKENYFLYLGRLNDDKGIGIAVDITKRLGIPLKIAGQGDPTRFLLPHVEYLGPLGIEERNKVLAKAKCVVAATRYVEPFCGVNVEAQMCFPYDVRVRANDIHKVYCNSYSGDLLKISTENSIVECTPEHPFLTHRGWVKAKDLALNDFLIKRKEHEQTEMDQKTIGDLVGELSQIGESKDVINARNAYRQSSKQSKKTKAVQRNIQTFHEKRNGSGEEILSIQGVDVCCENSKEKSFSDSEKSNIHEIKLPVQTSSFYKRRGGNYQEIVSDYESRSYGEIIGEKSSSNIAKMHEIGISKEVFGRDKISSSNSVSRRAGLSSCTDRWRRNDRIYESNKKAWKKKSISSGKSIKYVITDYRVGKIESSVYLSVYKSANKNAKNTLLLRLCKIDDESSSIRKTIALSHTKEASNGDDYRVDKDTVESMQRRPTNSKSEIFIENDSVYEFERIRSISRRKVEDLSVYNLGTSLGAYEANGFIVHNCGTPIISTDWGIFPETVLHGVTGYRCRTLEQFIWAAKNIDKINPANCRAWAIKNFSIKRVALMYEEFFQQVLNLKGPGWPMEFPERNQLDWLRKVYPVGSISDIDLERPHVAPVLPKVEIKKKSEWEEAQAWEQVWWKSATPEKLADEKRKQRTYAKLMGLPDSPRGLGPVRVLDLGCGPISMMTDYELGPSVGVDPLPMPATTVKTYTKNAITLINKKIEDAIAGGELTGPFDEVWCYNCLQHVDNLELILSLMGSVAPSVRVFEWIDLGKCPGHPHTLTESQFLKSFPEDKWEHTIWNTGVLKGFGGTVTNKYIALWLNKKK